VFSRAHLLRTVWGFAVASPRTVDVHVTRLRAKLATPVVRTVRGVGYRLEDAAAITLVGAD
jgi:DNA-binding response OmpR family regulator